MKWLTRVKGWLAGLGIFIGAVTLALLTGRRQGSRAKQQEQVAEAAQAQQEGVEARNDAKKDVDKLPDGAAADELKRDWMRD